MEMMASDPMIMRPNGPTLPSNCVKLINFLLCA
jgi:hypothetical protein